MNLPEGAIPIEQWKPDPLKIMSVLAEILGRRDGCTYEVVPAPQKQVCPSQLEGSD